MKKLVALLCTAAMVLSTAAVAFANPSISTIAPESVKVSAATQAALPAGATLKVAEPKTDAYKTPEVKTVVDKLNSSTEVTTVKEMLETLKVDTTKEIKTTGDTVVEDIEAYAPISKFMDLVMELSDGSETYELGEKVELTITVEAVKGADPKNLLIMQVDPETGDVYFIEIDEDDFDPETGEITAEFPCLGPITILEKPAA